MENYLIINPERIQRGLIEKRWSMAMLSQRANIGYSGLRELLKGRRNRVHRNTILKMADALDADPVEFVLPSVR